MNLSLKSLRMAALLAGAVAYVLVLFPSTPAHAVEPAPFTCSKTYDPASETTLTGTSTTVTCPGVSLGDYVQVSSSIDAALITVTGYVSAANAVTIRLFNGTAGTIDLGSSTWRVRVTPHQ